jgi:hypothetical protein
MSPSYQVRARQRRQKVLIQSCCATVAPIDGFQSGPALRLHAFDIPTPGSRSEPPTPLTQRVPPVCCHLPWFTGVCILLSRTWRPRLLLRPWDMLRCCVRRQRARDRSCLCQAPTRRMFICAASTILGFEIPPSTLSYHCAADSDKSAVERIASYKRRISGKTAYHVTRRDRRAFSHHGWYSHFEKLPILPVAC